MQQNEQVFLAIAQEFPYLRPLYIHVGAGQKVGPIQKYLNPNQVVHIHAQEELNPAQVRSLSQRKPCPNCIKLAQRFGAKIVPRRMPRRMS